jgi:TonB family protein
MGRYLRLLSLSVVMLSTFSGFAQTVGPKWPPTDSLVSTAFNKHQYMNARAAGVRPPKVLASPDPEYPWAAQRRGIQGTVRLAVAINKNGGIDKVKVVRRLDPDLDQAAVNAITQWRFAPAEKDGEAVPFQILVEVSWGAY